MVVNISYSTLNKYVCEDMGKGRELGKVCGHHPLLNYRDQYFVRNVLARNDRATEGANMQESVDLIQDMAHYLSCNQNCK
jgi:hypothetical protein